MHTNRQRASRQPERHHFLVIQILFFFKRKERKTDRRTDGCTDRQRDQKIDRQRKMKNDRQTEIWTANKTDEIQMSRRKYMYSKMNGSVVKNA